MHDTEYVRGLIRDGQLDFAKSLILGDPTLFGATARDRLLAEIACVHRKNQLAANRHAGLDEHEAAIGDLVDLRACCD